MAAGYNTKTLETRTAKVHLIKVLPIRLLFIVVGHWTTGQRERHRRMAGWTDMIDHIYRTNSSLFVTPTGILLICPTIVHVYYCSWCSDLISQNDDLMGAKQVGKFSRFSLQKSPFPLFDGK